MSAELKLPQNSASGFDAKEEADNMIIRIAIQQRDVNDFFRKTTHAGINEVYTNFDEEGLYLMKDGAVENSIANDKGHRAFITWRRW